MINQLAENQVTDLLNKYHGFFAFSNKQFDEGIKEGFTYVRMPHGMFAPKQYADTLANQICKAYQDAAKTIQGQKSKKDRIWYELANHECQITYDYSDAVSALSCFDDITEQDVKDQWSSYLQHCVDNDYF